MSNPTNDDKQNAVMFTGVIIVAVCGVKIHDRC